MDPEEDVIATAGGGGDTSPGEPTTTFELEWDNLADCGYDRVCDADNIHSWAHQTSSKSSNDHQLFNFSPWSHFDRQEILPEVSSLSQNDTESDACAQSGVLSRFRIPSKKPRSLKSFCQTAFIPDDEGFYSIYSTEYYTCQSASSGDDLQQSERKRIHLLFSTVKIDMDITITPFGKQMTPGIENNRKRNFENRVQISATADAHEKDFNCKQWLEGQAYFMNKTSARYSSSSMAVLSQSEDSVVKMSKHPDGNFPSKSLSDLGVQGHIFDLPFKDFYFDEKMKEIMLLKDCDILDAGEDDDCADENADDIDKKTCALNSIPTQHASESYLAENSSADNDINIDKFDKLNDPPNIVESVNKRNMLVSEDLACPIVIYPKKSHISQDFEEKSLNLCHELAKPKASPHSDGITPIPSGQSHPDQVTVSMETFPAGKYVTDTSDIIRPDVDCAVAPKQSSDDHSMELEHNRSTVVGNKELLSMDNNTVSHRDKNSCPVEASSGADPVMFKTADIKNMLQRTNSKSVRSLIESFEEPKTIANEDPTIFRKANIKDMSKRNNTENVRPLIDAFEEPKVQQEKEEWFSFKPLYTPFKTSNGQDPQEHYTFEVEPEPNGIEDELHHDVQQEGVFGSLKPLESIGFPVQYENEERPVQMMEPERSTPQEMSNMQEFAREIVNDIIQNAVSKLESELREFYTKRWRKELESSFGVGSGIRNHEDNVAALDAKDDVVTPSHEDNNAILDAEEDVVTPSHVDNNAILDAEEDVVTPSHEDNNAVLDAGEDVVTPSHEDNVAVLDAGEDWVTPSHEDKVTVLDASQKQTELPDPKDNEMSEIEIPDAPSLYKLNDFVKRREEESQQKECTTSQDLETRFNKVEGASVNAIPVSHRKAAISSQTVKQKSDFENLNQQRDVEHEQITQTVKNLIRHVISAAKIQIAQEKLEMEYQRQKIIRMKWDTIDRNSVVSTEQNKVKDNKRKGSCTSDGRCICGPCSLRWKQKQKPIPRSHENGSDFYIIHRSTTSLAEAKQSKPTIGNDAKESKTILPVNKTELSNENGSDCFIIHRSTTSLAEAKQSKSTIGNDAKESKTILPVNKTGLSNEKGSDCFIIHRSTTSLAEAKQSKPTIGNDTKESKTNIPVNQTELSKENGSELIIHRPTTTQAEAKKLKPKIRRSATESKRILPVRQPEVSHANSSGFIYKAKMSQEEAKQSKKMVSDAKKSILPVRQPEVSNENASGFIHKSIMSKEVAKQLKAITSDAKKSKTILPVGQPEVSNENGSGILNKSTMSPAEAKQSKAMIRKDAKKSKTILPVMQSQVKYADMKPKSYPNKGTKGKKLSPSVISDCTMQRMKSNKTGKDERKCHKTEIDDTSIQDSNQRHPVRCALCRKREKKGTT